MEYIHYIICNNIILSSTFVMLRKQCKMQVKRLELLLNKCKETMRADKERVQQLTEELEQAQKQLQIKTKEFESLQVINCPLCWSVDLSICHVPLNRIMSVFVLEFYSAFMADIYSEF